jgi:hypothetical protein
MAYKYNFVDSDYVKIDSEKFNKALQRKKMTQTDVIKDLEWSSSAISYALKHNRINYKFLKECCKVINMKPATFITDSKPDNRAKANKVAINGKKGKKKPVKVKKEKKPTSGRYPWSADRKPNEKDIKAMEKEFNAKLEEEGRKVIGTASYKKSITKVDPDKPLIVELKTSKSEMQELIDVQKEIRDALKALVEELR